MLEWWKIEKWFTQNVAGSESMLKALIDKGAFLNAVDNDQTSGMTWSYWITMRPVVARTFFFYSNNKCQASSIYFIIFLCSLRSFISVYKYVNLNGRWNRILFYCI